MNNKVLFEQWLRLFKKNANGTKFKSVGPYINYLSYIEKLLNMSQDSIFAISTEVGLQKLERKLQKSTDFQNLTQHRQSNLLSALHVYQDLIGILEKSNDKI